MPAGVPDPIAVLRGHSGEVQALEFDDAERLLISGDAHGEVRVWDLQDLRPLLVRRLHPPTVGVLCLRFLGPQRQLLTQGRDGVAHLWAFGDAWSLSEQPVRSFIRAAYSFCRCSVLQLGSADAGHGAAAAGGAHLIEPHAEGIQDLAAELLAPEPATSEANCTLIAAPPPAETEAATAVGHAAEPEAQASAGPCLHACTASGGGPVALLAMADDEGKDAEVWCCCCGQHLAHLRQSAADCGAAKLGMVLAVALFQRPGLQHIAYLAAGYENGTLVVWELVPPGARGSEGGACAPDCPGELHPRVVAYRKLFAEPVMAVGLAPGGEGGVCGAAEDKLVCFVVDWVAGRLGVRHSIDLRCQGISDVVVRQDGRIVATGGWDGRVRIYKYRSGRPLAVLKYHSEAATALAFGPRTMALATAARDGTVALWDVYQPGP